VSCFAIGSRRLTQIEDAQREIEFAAALRQLCWKLLSPRCWHDLRQPARANGDAERGVPFFSLQLRKYFQLKTQRKREVHFNDIKILLESNLSLKRH